MAIKINYDKCHVIHIGHNNLYFDYNYIEMHKIIMSKCEKVLGIYVNEKSSSKEHVYECVNKACRMYALN